MADLKLYTPCLTDDTVKYDFKMSVDSGDAFSVSILQSYDSSLSGTPVIFSNKLPGNSNGIEVSVLQDKSGIQVVTSDGVSSYTDTSVISFSEEKLYSNVFIWNGIIGENAFFSNGGTLQPIDTTNWLTWVGDSSDFLTIGCNSETQLVKSGFTYLTFSEVNNYNHNEGLVSYGESGDFDVTLTTGNWQPELEYPADNTAYPYDVWTNDSTGDYILFYFLDDTTPFKTDGDTLTGYTWLTQVLDYAYISKYNGFKIVDPRDNITLLGYDEITDVSEDGYIFYNEENGVIKGLIIYDEKQTGECYNKAVDEMESMKLNALQDVTGEYIFDVNNEYIITKE